MRSFPIGLTSLANTSKMQVRHARTPLPTTMDRQHSRLGFKKGTSVRLLLLKNFGQQTTAQT